MAEDLLDLTLRDILIDAPENCSLWRFSGENVRFYLVPKGHQQEKNFDYISGLSESVFENNELEVAKETEEGVFEHIYVPITGLL